MLFHDRSEAGQRLASRLIEFAHVRDGLVLGIPRGGVSVAFEIALRLHAPLDVFLSCKLGVPGHEELAFGAVALGNARYLDEQIIRTARIAPEQVELVTRNAHEKLERRARLYHPNRPPLDVRERTVILVDDGIATGASIYAAICALREMKPKALIAAVPVAPAAAVHWLRSLVDMLMVLHAPTDFDAVGQFYQRFSQVSDEEVISLLHRAETSWIPLPADTP